MRRLLTSFVVTAIAAIVPTLALAGNQEVAEQIAHRLGHSGQMSDYKIGVKYQDGTAWLCGRVSSEEQMNMALRLTFQISSVNRVINELTVAGSEAAQSAESESADGSPQPGADENGSGSPQAMPSGYNPLRGQDAAPAAPRPQKRSLIQRLESAIAGGSQEGSADRVASSYGPAAVQPVADVEPQPLPQQQQVRPVANTARGESRMAMMQSNMRGPVAPNGAPLPMYRAAASQAGVAPARYDQPCMPNYAWPSYAAYPNYAAVTYPKQYSPTAWPYIGPFYPYPQVPLGWRKVTLEWDSGWWFLDFKDQPASCWHR
jgi:hypothetical protein